MKKIYGYSLSSLVLMALWFTTSCGKDEQPEEDTVAKEIKKIEPQPEPSWETQEPEEEFEPQTPFVAKAYRLFPSTSLSVGQLVLEEKCDVCDCNFQFYYPQLQGMGSQSIQESVNTQLRAAFYQPEKACGDLGKGDVYTESASFQVKLLSEAFLSIYGYHEAYSQNTPTNARLLFSQNFYLPTGEPLPFSSLFADTQSLNQLIANYWRKNKITYLPEELRSSYSFFLTETHLVLINMITKEGIVGETVPLSYRSILPLLKTDSPLHQELTGSSGI